MRAAVEKKVAKVEKLKKDSKDLRRSTSANVLLSKKRLTERAAAAEAQAAAQEEIHALKAALVKEKGRHINELAVLRSENERLKKWTDGLLSELKSVQAELDEGGGDGGDMQRLLVESEAERSRLAADLKRREEENKVLRSKLTEKLQVEVRGAAAEEEESEEESEESEEEGLQPGADIDSEEVDESEDD